jgi:hypothetical protein
VRKRDEPVERERQQREEHARREGEAIEQAKERYREEGQVSIMGIRCRPDGRVIR